MSELCPSCGEQMVYCDEPMVSGYKGYVCTEPDCPRDT